MRHIRKNDIVVLLKDITACRGSHEARESEDRSKWATDQGDKAKVLAVYPDKGKVVVEGVNYRYKHVRRSNEHPHGGRVQKEGVIDISNVLPYCSKCDRGVRVKAARNEAGKKVRACVHCGGTIGAA
jgi:large subunit ribosomal protein L24